MNDTTELLRIFQSTLGSCREKCDDSGKVLWDRIEAALPPSPVFDVWLRHSGIPGGAVAYGHLLAAFEAGAAYDVPKLPEGKRERMAFYEAAMKDKKNHPALALELAFLHETVDDAQEVISDHRRLVREMDVALNGEEGAAKQASLCDLVAQVRGAAWSECHECEGFRWVWKHGIEESWPVQCPRCNWDCRYGEASALSSDKDAA